MLPCKKTFGDFKLEEVTLCHGKRSGGTAGGVSVASSVANAGPSPVFASKTLVAVQTYGPLSPI